MHTVVEPVVIVKVEGDVDCRRKRRRRQKQNEFVRKHRRVQVEGGLAPRYEYRTERATSQIMYLLVGYYYHT
jgi:hypothetical protein